MTEYVFDMDSVGEGGYVRQMREEVVKCRNCKHSYQDIPSAYFQCVRLFAKVSPDSFCSCGERRES